MKKILKGMLILFILSLAAAAGLYNYGKGVLKSIPDQKIKSNLEILEVKSGQTPMQIISETIENPLDDIWYRLWFRQNPQMTKIKHGYYGLNGVYTLSDLFTKLTTGRQLSLNFTIVAGTRADKILSNLSHATLVDHTMQDEKAYADYLSHAKLSQSSLEGLFLPDTYAYDPNERDTVILNFAHDSLVKYLNQEWENRDHGVSCKSAYEALIMASIIEKETSVADEYSLVSAVFNNRLKKGMRLQTDPTVIYGVKDRYSGKITKSDLKDDNPYNTYVIYGLPPTPIAMASKETIHAALHPADVDYLFFVANGNGGHTFTSNLRDHNNAVNEYKRLLRENKAKNRKNLVKEQIINVSNELENAIGDEAKGLGSLVKTALDTNLDDKVKTEAENKNADENKSADENKPDEKTGR